jgi:hypothetical protein
VIVSQKNSMMISRATGGDIYADTAPPIIEAVERIANGTPPHVG